MRQVIGKVQTLGRNGRFRGEDVAGASKGLHLPSASASGERKRSTCGQGFRIKGGCIFQNRERENPAGMRPSGLSPLIRIKLQASSVSFMDTDFP